MPVDVLTQIVIDRPIDQVATFTTDPTNAPQWYANIKSVEWKTTPPLVLALSTPEGLFHAERRGLSVLPPRRMLFDTPPPPTIFSIMSGLSP